MASFANEPGLNDDSVPDEEVDDQMNNCKVCMKPFNKLLGHLRFQKVCREGYGEEELNRLKEEQSSKRRKDKAKWKHEKELQQNDSKEIQQLTKCKVCQGSFKTIKGHFRFNPDCKRQYSDAELSKLEMISDPNRKDYFSKYHKEHRLDKHSKSNKNFHDQINYVLYEDSFNSKLPRISAIFSNTLILKRTSCTELQTEIVNLLNEFVSKDHELYHQVTCLNSKIDETNLRFDDVKRGAMMFFQQLGWRLSDRAREKLTKYLHLYIKETFDLTNKILQFTLQKLKTPDEEHYLELAPMIGNKNKEYENQVRELHKDYLRNYLEVQVLCKFDRYNPKDVLSKMKIYLQMKIQSHLELYSTWIPKYKNVIADYKKWLLEEDCQAVLMKLELEVNKCVTDCQNRVDDLKEICDEYAVIRDGVYDALIRSLELITSTFHDIKETNQILLRYYREEFDENLQQFGFDATYSDAEFDLGFGSDPDFDLIGESNDNKYFRHEEDGKKELQSKRKRHETLQFLLDLPESEWKNVAIDNQ